MIEERTTSSKAIEAAHKAAQATGEPAMRVKVYSPFKVYFDEDALSVSAENATGPFDILAKHHRFITLLSPCELVIRSAQRSGEDKIRISGGLMHVKEDMIRVFLDV